MQNENVPSSHRQPTNAPPTRPGVYWFQGETMSGYVLVNVSRKNGELTAWLVDRDVPVADLNGAWGNPMPSFYE